MRNKLRPLVANGMIFCAMLLFWTVIPIGLFALISGSPILGLVLFSYCRLKINRMTIGLPTSSVVVAIQDITLVLCAFVFYPGSFIACSYLAIIAFLFFGAKFLTATSRDNKTLEPAA